MQYIAWPDHGVPDDSTDFLHFVLKVRQNRTGMVEPTVVHCRSAHTHTEHITGRAQCKDNRSLTVLVKKVTYLVSVV